MIKSDLVKRKERVAARDKLVKQNICPNCKIPLREKWFGGLSCHKCGWEKPSIFSNGF